MKKFIIVNMIEDADWLGHFRRLVPYLIGANGHKVGLGILAWRPLYGCFDTKRMGDLI